jgi:hypothetical protein
VSKLEHELPETQMGAGGVRREMDQCAAPLVCPRRQQKRMQEEKSP